MKILYSEGDLLEAARVRQRLEKYPSRFSLEITDTKADAISRIEQKTTAYDLALVNLRSLNDEGFALLAHLRERSLPLAVVALISPGDEEAEELTRAALEAGAIDYLIGSGDYLERLPLTLESAMCRYRARTALCENLAQCQAVIESLPVGVIIQGPQAEILLTNPKAVELLVFNVNYISRRRQLEFPFHLIKLSASPR